MILEAGADINACGGGDSNALMDATFQSHLEVVQLLVEHRANVNLSMGNKHSYSYPLTVTAFNGDESIIQVILEAGANINN